MTDTKNTHGECVKNSGPQKSGALNWNGSSYPKYGICKIFFFLIEEFRWKCLPVILFEGFYPSCRKTPISLSTLEKN